MMYDKTTLREKTTVMHIDTRCSLVQLKTKFLFDYEIFPNNVMSHLTEWKYEHREMRIGDTIVQQVYLPPTRRLSQKIIVGVRISEIVNEPTRQGFCYDTIAGHVENGTAEFTVEQSSDGKIIFKIHTFSRPSILLARVVGPFFSIPYQSFLTRQALKNVKRQLESQ